MFWINVEIPKNCKLGSDASFQQRTKVGKFTVSSFVLKEDNIFDTAIISENNEIIEKDFIRNITQSEDALMKHFESCQKAQDLQMA